MRLLCRVVQSTQESSWASSPSVSLRLADQVVTGPYADEADGIDDLAQSYSRAFGPGSVGDFTYWSGLTQMAKPLQALGFPLVSPTPDAVPECCVVPEYDNIFFAAKQRLATLSEAKKRLIFSPSAGMYGAVFDADQVVAAWRRRAGTDELDVHKWAPLSRGAARESDALRTWYRTAGSGA